MIDLIPYHSHGSWLLEDKFAALRTKIFTESLETSNEPRLGGCVRVTTCHNKSQTSDRT